MYLTLFAAAMLVTNALALVILVRGLGAKTRSGCSARAAWCVLLGILSGAILVAFYAAALVRSFARVADVDPSEKARVLSEGISGAMRVVSWGVLATLPPFIYACVLFVRRYRFPAEAPRPAGTNEQS